MSAFLLFLRIGFVLIQFLLTMYLSNLIDFASSI